MTVFYTRFLSPTPQKCAESLKFWQFFYYRPPGKFQYTAGEIVEMWCQKLDIFLYIYIYRYYPLGNRYRFSISVQPEITPLFFFFFNVKKNVFQKLAGLCLVGKAVNIYGSKAADGCLAFQRRSCSSLVAFHKQYLHWAGSASFIRVTGEFPTQMVSNAESVSIYCSY